MMVLGWDDGVGMVMVVMVMMVMVMMVLE